jgi:hypothetical protein
MNSLLSFPWPTLQAMTIAFLGAFLSVVGSTVCSVYGLSRLARVTKATGIGIFIAGFALSFSSMVYVAFFE